MKNIILVVSVLVSVHTFAAGGGSSIGPANPAAMNCMKLKGTLETVQKPNGESVNCVVEEWQLFREMFSRGLVEEHQCVPGGMPNPAAVNCADIGGIVRIVATPGGQTGYCVVEQWTLFRAIDVITHP